MMKKIALIFAVALLIAACDRVREEVVTTFPDGSPELVYLVKGKADAPLLMGEKRYYSNGEKHSEIHYMDDEKTPSGVWQFYYPTGALFAKADYSKGGRWTFHTDGERNAFLQMECDSMCMAQLSEKNLPLEVHRCKGDSTWVYTFYEDFLEKSEGLMVGGVRDGKWLFFYPNGQLQLEALFIGGVENGMYNSYRENGIPIFRGFYINGQRAGIWEFYDQQGDLSGRLNYDSK